MSESHRNDAIDWLRGVVMVLMALDHVRYFFTNVPFQPEDLGRTWPALFFTRWVTHYCAPVFFFLAGVAAFLGARRRTPSEHTQYLLRRGLWLVVLELTVIGFGWSFRVGDSFAGVIWALGWSMVLLAVMWRLSSAINGLIAVVVIVLHGWTLSMDVGELGSAGRILWRFLHLPGTATLWGGLRYPVLYPLVPWFAVMLLGFAAGRLWTWEPARRQQALTVAGITATLLFVVLRVTNLYGNPEPFTAKTDVPMTLVAMLNVAKYPPSLQFLLMTLGPAWVVLAVADRRLRDTNRVSGALVTFGRVPFFFYICHLYLIHLLALPWPRVSLPGVWLVWIGVVVALYFPSRWFAKLKEKRRDWWLSYV